MDHQAPLRGKTTVHPSDNGSAIGSDHGLAEFIDDLVTLTELQASLAVVDFKDRVRRAAVPLAVTLSCLIVLAACVPVVLVGLALLLATGLNIHEGLAMVFVGAAAAALAIPAAAFGLVRLIRTCDNSFRSSREELRRNLAWLRSVLVARRH